MIMKPSYANGIYDYYDVEQIEEFVAFKGTYEIESLFEKYEAFDDLEESYMDMEEIVTAKIAEYVDEHLDQFAKIVE
mgnify:CR=1 FL=1